MRILKLALILLFPFSYFGCEKVVEVKPQTGFTGDVFIESLLFPGELPQVFVSRSLPFFDESVTPQEIFARGASVIIEGTEGTQMLLPDSTFDQFRCRWVPFYGGQIPAQMGSTYKLTVTFDGETYTASTTIDQPKVNMDTVEYVAEFFDIYGGHDGVIITFHDAPGTGNFYRYQMDRMIDKNTHHVDVLEVIENTCVADGELYPVTDLGRSVFSDFDDETIDGQKLQLLIEVAFEYQKGDTGWVYLQSLDRNSAEFYRDLDEQLLSRENPFVEPVFIETQIEGAIGVFGSVVLSDPWLFIYPVSAD